MKALILVAAVAGILGSGAAQAAITRHIPIVSPYRAGQAQGYVVAVRGKADVHSDSAFQGIDVNLIDANGHVVFIGFIPKLNEYAFPDALALNGKQVVMYGIIEIYWGLPATQLIYPDQLRPAPGA